MCEEAWLNPVRFSQATTNFQPRDEVTSAQHLAIVLWAGCELELVPCLHVVPNSKVSPARPEFQTHDTTFSPVRLSPPTSGLPCSPGAGLSFFTPSIAKTYLANLAALFRAGTQNDPDT